jgi:hypothetical protein
MLPTPSLAPRSYREQDVLLVLVDGTWIWDGVGVFDHGHTLTGQQRLIDTNGCRKDRGYANIGGHLVAHSYFDDVTRDELARFDALDLTWSILSNDFGDFGLVFFESFDGTLCIAFLGMGERSMWM